MRPDVISLIAPVMAHRGCDRFTMLYLRAFGGLALENGGRPIVGATAQRARLAMLVVLAASADRGISRDRLLALFWPEKDTDHARAALRQALYALRRDAGEPELILGTTELTLNPTVISGDVLDFDIALNACDFASAVALYAGPMLDGVHLTDVPELERWIESERERRAQQYRMALAHLATSTGAKGDQRAAAALWRKLAASDPLSPTVAVSVMKALVRIGEPSAAIQHARAYERLVRAELDATPDRSVVTLAQEIRLGLQEETEPTAAPSVGDIHAGSAHDKPEAGQSLRVPNEPLPLPSPAVHAPKVARPHTRLAFLAGGVVLALSTLLMFRAVREARGHTGPIYRRSAIAVLLFQNLSVQPEYAYFAGGLHDELVTQLSKVADLTVTSGQSVMGYAGTNTPPLKQIARELEVGSVVEGSVQVVGNRLRVIVQLIDASTNARVWAEHYDRTLDDVFAIESDVARQIVAAVGAAVSGAEARALATVHTANAEAYRLYLQGRQYSTRSFSLSVEDLDIAQHFYERAVTLDSSFALAHAALSQLHGVEYITRYDRSPARAARQRDEAATALRLAPDLPQAHLAMGSWHYWARGDYPRALAELRIAVAGLPNDVEVWARIGQVTRRMGNWTESIAAHEKTTELNPRDAGLFKELGVTYLWMHRYAEAAGAFDRAFSLAPDIPNFQILKGLTYVRWLGQLDTLRAVLQSREWIPTDEDWSEHALALLYWGRQADSMVRISRTARAGVFQGQNFFVPAALYAAWAHQLLGDRAAARSAFESASVFVDSAITEHPDDERMHAARGLALAGLGRREEALREARWLQQSVAYREDKFQGGIVVENHARILARVGDVDTAMDEIESLLARPSHLSVHTLQLDPAWDPIRNHARFRAFSMKYAVR